MKLPAAALLLAAGAFAQEPAGVIAGTVRSALSRRVLPSTGIELTLNPASDAGQRAVLHAAADIQGVFRFAGLPAGEAVLSFSKAGYEAGGKRTLQVAVEPDREVNDLDIELRPSAAVSGKVLDRDGDPVTRAVAQLQTAVLRAGVKSLRTVRTARTDDRGHYRLYDLAPGRYYLSVSPARSLRVIAAAGIREFAHSWGYFPGAPTPRGAERIVLTWGSERAGVDFQLGTPPRTAVGGFVRNLGGRSPCVSCPVSIMRCGEGQIGSITTDETGGFFIRGLPAGDYVLRANALEGPRFNAAQRVLLVEGEPVQADMVLRTGSVVRGRVTALEYGETAAAADRADPLIVTLTAVDGSRSRRLRAMPAPAAGGEFEIIDVGRRRVPGRHRRRPPRQLSARGLARRTPAPRAPHHGCRRRGSERPADRSRRRRRDRSRQGGRRAICVRRARRPRPASRCCCRTEGIGGYRREYLGDYRPGDGLFAIFTVPPGSYHVFAVPRDEPWDLTDPLDLGRLRSAGKAIRLRANEEAAVDAPYVAAPR